MNQPVDEFHGLHSEDGGDDVVRVVLPPTDSHQAVSTTADKHEASLQQEYTTVNAFRKKVVI